MYADDTNILNAVGKLAIVGTRSASKLDCLFFFDLTSPHMVVLMFAWMSEEEAVLNAHQPGRNICKWI